MSSITLLALGLATLALVVLGLAVGMARVSSRVSRFEDAARDAALPFEVEL